VVWGGDKDLLVRIEFEGALLVKGSREPVEYSITIGQREQNLGHIHEERATLGKEKQVLFERQEASTETVLSYSRPNDTESFALYQAVRSWSSYDFQRSKIAQRQPVKKETRLAPDGSNTATVLHWVRNEDVDTFNRLESLLKTAIPEVEYLLTPPDEQGQVYIAFNEKHISGRIPAWNLSEGSARLVATLLALFVPSPPALVAIEAPESSLHPYLMEYLADILKLGSKETQILITTHSPYLLDHLPPESLVIITKERGETKARRVRKDRALKEALEVLGLGEMWLAGHLGGVP
jgi:predicted ATPase